MQWSVETGHNTKHSRKPFELPGQTNLAHQFGPPAGSTRRTQLAHWPGAPTAAPYWSSSAASSAENSGPAMGLPSSSCEHRTTHAISIARHKSGQVGTTETCELGTLLLLLLQTHMPAIAMLVLLPSFALLPSAVVCSAMLHGMPHSSKAAPSSPSTASAAPGCLQWAPPGSHSQPQSASCIRGVSTDAAECTSAG
jgi:hypothetical protein